MGSPFPCGFTFRVEKLILPLSVGSLPPSRNDIRRRRRGAAVASRGAEVDTRGGTMAFRAASHELAHLKREVEQLRGQVHDRRSLPAVVSSLKELVQSFPAEESEREREREREMEIRPNIEFVEEELADSVNVSDHRSMASFSSDESRVSPSPSFPSMSEFSIDLMTETPSGVAPMRPRTELRKGAEGDEVQALQEALEVLGFYSGEEDIEYAMFAEGTKAAVKTWQATLGVRKDGVASPALLAILFGEENPNPTAPNPNANGRNLQDPAIRALESATRGDNGKQLVARENVCGRQERRGGHAGRQDGCQSQSVSAGRESLGGAWATATTRDHDSTSNGAQSAAPKSQEKCFSCKGEGTCMCTECEGTGDLNVEDQFLDWVEEGAKCLLRGLRCHPL